MSPREVEQVSWSQRCFQNAARIRHILDFAAPDRALIYRGGLVEDPPVLAAGDLQDEDIRLVIM